MAKLALRLASVTVLARLLTPDAYGLHGMAVTLYGLLYMARDLGVFTAVQQPGLTPARFNALCRLAALGGVTLASLCVLLGPPAAWFYAEPRLPAVLAGLGVAFLFGGLAVPPLALLYREQQVATVMAIDVLATAAATAFAIGAAAAGWGVWSLVVMAVVQEVASAAASWWRSPWRPGLDTSGIAWRELLGDGASLASGNMASYLTRTVDQMIVGWSQGTAALGYYGRGAQATTAAMLLVVAPFNGWAVASLARCRDQPDDFRQVFRRLLNGVMHLALPPAVVCVAAPDTVVRWLYGAPWLPAADVVRWLGLALVGQPLVFAQFWLLQATVQPARLLRLSVLGFAAVTAACLLAKSAGLASLALAAALAGLVQGFGGLALCLGRTPVQADDLLRALAGPVLLHGGLCTALAALRGSGAIPPGWLPAAAAAGYGLAWLLVPAVRRELRGHFLSRP